MSETNLRGMAFANFANNSLLGQALRSKGWSSIPDSNIEDKDYGEGAVATFECGFVDFCRFGIKIHLYQSRFSDQWRLNILDMPQMISAESLNDRDYVDQLVRDIEGGMEFSLLVAEWATKYGVSFHGDYAYLPDVDRPIFEIGVNEVLLLFVREDPDPKFYVSAADPTFFDQIEKHIEMRKR